MEDKREVWQRGPLENIPSLLQPVAHALLQAREELFDKQVDLSIHELSTVNIDILTEARTVGRKLIPTTLIGLYVHASEHTMRHIGQLLVTVKVLKDR